MPPWPAEETPRDVELATLKRAKQKLADQLTDRDNEVRTLREQHGELRKELKEANYQAQREARQASEAQESLRKKTDAHNSLKIQKDNAETALLAAEATVRERDGEIKKLTYQLEITSVRSATAAESKVAEEKAALEKRVHQLSMELQKAHLELQQEKENRSLSTATLNEGKCATTGSKIARPPSRSSIAPTDTSRGRFGFQANQSSGARSRTSTSTSASESNPTSGSIRPPSALANHSSIPGPSKLPARRPSVSGSIPTAVNTSSASSGPAQPPPPAAKLAQLESSLSSAQDTISHLSADLADARSTVESLETDLATTRVRLGDKKDELLRVENRLIALERSSREELDALRESVDEARQDVEVARDETNEVRDELAQEVERAVAAAEADRRELEGRYNALVAELDGLEGELERRDGEREDLLRLLREASERETDLKETLEEKEDECVELENELAYLEETHAEAMDEAKEHREDLEAEIAGLRGAQGRVEQQEHDLEELEGNREELERLLAETREECNDLRAQLRATDDSRAESVNERDLETEELASRPDEETSLSKSGSRNLDADLAILEAEVFKKETEIDSLNYRLTQFGDLESDHEAAVDRVETLSTELDAKVAQLANLSAQLEAMTSSFASTRDDAERHETSATRLKAEVSSLAGERDELLSRVSASSEMITGLESELAQLRTLAARSHDDSDVANLQEQLSVAQEEVATLQKRLQELEDAEWMSNEASKDLANRIASLEEEVARLEESLETEHGATLTAELDLEQARKTLEETKAQLEAVEGALELETKAREGAERDRAELEERLGDSDTFAPGHVEDLDREIDQLHAQLDEVRARADDEAYTHLQEVSDLQIRLRSQENQIEDFQRELIVVDALRRILGDTEARVDSLGWDLKAAHSAMLEERGIADDKLEALNRRFEASEDECLRLRTELDETRHRLSDAQDALDQTRIDLAASTASAGLDRASPGPPSPVALSPSPTNLSFGMSPGSDPTILVTRLREERDELRSRLDFARTEADFRVKALQKRLEESEQNKTKALSIMEVDLLDKAAALEHECDMNARIEEALRSAKTDKERIEEELESATKELKAATGKVDEFEKRLQEAEKAREAHETERESAWALEGELDAATKSANTIRAELDAANEAKAELNSSLDSLRTDLRQAAAEIDRQHNVAAASDSRIAELETALAIAREQEAARQGDALADFATLCETLESDVSGLRTRIAQQTAVIAERERSISLLQLNLAVRVAIDVDDVDGNDSEEAEGDRSIEEEDLEAGDRTIAVEPSSSPSHLAELEARLSEELSARRELELKLAIVQAQLDAARQQAVVDSATLEEDLVQAREAARERQGRLDEAQLSLEALRRRHDEIATERNSLAETVESLRSGLAGLESTHTARGQELEELQSKVAAKHDELTAANERIVALKSSASTSAGTAQSRIADLERQLADIEVRLSQALSDVADSNDRAQLSEASYAALQGQHSALGSDFEQLKATRGGEEERALEAASKAESEIARLCDELVKAEEYSILHEQAQRRISILEEQLAAARDSLSTSAANNVTSNEEETVALTARLEAALSQVDELSRLLEEARESASLATAAAEGAVQAEKETGLKAKAAGDRAAREIQTLRQLGRASQAEAEALSAEVEALSALSEEATQLRNRVGELEAHIELVVRSAEEDKTEAHRKKKEEFEEMLVCLQKYEGQIDDLNYSVIEKVARIEELEQASQQQMEEIDEANENLIESLKVQKKYSAQMERLKAKIATLQRDLAQAKSTTPAPVLTSAPGSAPPTESASLPLSNKKRRAPAEFDPPTLSATSPAPAPRAIVASRPTTQSASTTEDALDKENSGPMTAPRSKVGAALAKKRSDSVVPLKPEHRPVQRAALRPVDENSTVPVVTEIKVKPASSTPSMSTLSAGSVTGVGGGGGGGGGGGNAKLDALKAKLAAQKKRTRSGLSSGASAAPTST